MPKVSIQRSLGGLNSIEVKIKKESHTVAAPLVERMNNDPNCIYAAYKIFHPSDEFVSIKLQGNDIKNARDILEDALRSLISDIEDVIVQVKKKE